MGIGRFAFTPVLPMMRHEGALSITGAAWLAFAAMARRIVSFMVTSMAAVQEAEQVAGPDSMPLISAMTTVFPSNSE
jgi:hypothetical protein